jgi:type IV secretion system protein VirB10
MKLAMRLPENSNETADRDPREDATTEVIDFASRTSYPAVANRKSKSDALGLAAGITFVAVLGAATLYGLNAGRMAEDDSIQAEPAPPAAPEPVAAVPAPMEVPAPLPEPEPVLVEAPQEDLQLGVNAYSSPTLVFDAGILPSTAANIAAAAEAAAVGADSPVIPGSGSAGDFAARIGGVGGGPALAVQSFDPATTVTQGTMIPAVLETAINTDIPGYVRAVVSQDVRSADGSRILVPRSSRLVGQYQSGLQAGQKRAYVIWTTLIRPDGVSVQIASPATGFDGSTGLTGEVNTHFFQRFGSAMLLSVIGGLTAVASGGTSVILGGGQDAASTALQQNGERPPTVQVRQGEPIRVFTSRHLDFSQAPQL